MKSVVREAILKFNSTSDNIERSREVGDQKIGKIATIVRTNHTLNHTHLPKQNLTSVKTKT